MTSDRNSETEKLKRDARRWVTQLASGEATTADAEALKRWRQQNAAHEAAYSDAVRVWKSIGPGGRVFIERRGAPAWSGHRANVNRRMVLGGAGAVAASAAAYAVINPPLDLWPSYSELRADYRTATGEQRRVSVANVAVHMNTRTSLAISRASDSDRVELISGEAAFIMPPESPRRLIVLAGNGRTVANRARFDVRNTGQSICVTCLEGEVQVEHGSLRATVGIGQQLRYDATGLLGQVVAVNASEVTSWQDGVIVFRHTPLSAAVAEINRYRPGKVMVLTTALSQRTVSGRFRVERIDEVLVWIERVTGATSRSLPGGIILLS
jgi:transmembrane sensor